MKNPSNSRNDNMFKNNFFDFYRKMSPSFKSDYKAVSEAIGTILLLAISISLVGIVAYWVQTLPEPQLAINANFEGSMVIEGGNHVVKIEHMGGDRLEVDSTNLHVKINGIATVFPLYESTLAVFDNGYWEVGEEWEQDIESLHSWVPTAPEVVVEIIDIKSDSLVQKKFIQQEGAVGDLPDLQISEEDITFRFINQTLRRGDWVNISTNIHNNGASDAANVIVRFFDGSEVISQNNKDYLFIGLVSSASNKTIYLNWTPDYSGVRTINAKLYSVQIEEDYTNNYASKKLEVEPILPKYSGPNLEVESIQFSPESPTHGDWVTISVFIKNIGDEGIGIGATINVSIWDAKGYLITKDTFINLSTTLTTNLTVYETLLPAFTHDDQTTFGGITTIFAEISTNIEESNDGDNRYYRHIQILPTILLVDDDGVFDKYTKDDTSSYMDAALQLAVGSGQFDIFRVKGLNGPKYSIGEKPLKNYDIVIWMTGYETTNTISLLDQNSIKEYLDNRGKLWLIGQNILTDIGTPNNFAYHYMGVTGHSITGTPDMLYGISGENLTEGMQLNTTNMIESKDNGNRLTLRNSAIGHQYIDGILGNQKDLGFNVNNSLKYNNITNRFKVVFFGWEFASINEMLDRNNVTIQVLKWFDWELEIGTDLAIASKGFSNEKPKFMDWITISATVRNNGPNDYSRVRIDFYIIDSEDNEEPIPEYIGAGLENVDNPQFISILGNGGEKEVRKKWLAIDVGLHTFRVVVDLENEIEEVSEENNDDFYSPLFVTQLEIGYTILLVDDDNSTNNGGSMVNASADIANSLDELGYVYDVYTTQGGMVPGDGPNITVMKHYNCVIWCTGYDIADTLRVSDQVHLTNYFTRSNFIEANFLGDTRFNAWIVGQDILDDLGGSGSVTPTTDSFIYSRLRVKMYSTVNSTLQSQLDGVTGDSLTHGITYPMIQSGLDKADIIEPLSDATGIFWQNDAHTYHNALKYNTTKHNLVFMPWSFSLINDSTTSQLTNESYKNELTYLILNMFSYPDQRFELKTSRIDITLSSYTPVLADSYIIKSCIYNVGNNDTNAIIRFLDGDTIIGTKSIFIGANSNSTTEVIWSPLYAGYRNIKISVDSENDVPEVFDQLNNNATHPNQYVFFFHDDLENGTSNWGHESTIVLINDESPLEHMDKPVYTAINDTWGETYGFETQYEDFYSANSSFYTMEPPGYESRGDVLLGLVIDDSASMDERGWLADAKIAARYLLTQLSDESNVTIWHFNGNHEWRALPFTKLEGSGRTTVNNSITTLSNPSGTTILWDAIGEAYTDVKNAMPANPGLNPAIVVLSDGADVQASDRSGLNVQKIEGGSDEWCPWGVMADGDQMYGTDSGGVSSRALHYGKYTFDWSDPANTTEWLETGTHGGSIDHTRTGLLYSDIPIYTIGLGLEHHEPENSPYIDVYPGEVTDYTNAFYNGTDGFFYSPYTEAYNESGTLEFNLWHIATTSNASYYYSPDTDDLADIFGQIAEQLSSVLSRGSRNSRAGAGLNITGDRYLTTNTFSLENLTSAKMSFYQKYDIGFGINGIVVQVGTPSGGGGSWMYEYIRPKQPYPGNYDLRKYRYDDYGNLMRWCWNGISGNNWYIWEYVELSLDNWTDQKEVRVRVRFLWSTYGKGGIYMIDDFKITAEQSDDLSMSVNTSDQWQLTNVDSHSDNYCWGNFNPLTNRLRGGLDNSLYTRLIDITNARNATLSAYFKFNINLASGRPPDGFRVEISDDSGITWNAINFGARAAWGVSGTDADAADGVPGDGKSYTGINSGNNWVEAGSLTRLNCDISGWAGEVIKLRFRVITASDTNPYFGNTHYESAAAGFHGIYVDDVIIYGYSLLN